MEENIEWSDRAKWLYLKAEWWRFHVYKHRQPLCEEWKHNLEKNGYGFCRHMAKARYDYFKKELDSLFSFKW